MKKNILLILILSVLFELKGETPVRSIFQDNSTVFAEKWKYIGIAVEEPGYHVYGSSPIIDENGRINLFCSRWPVSATFDPGWRSHSEIAQYVADSPEGPFRFVQVVHKGNEQHTWDKYGICNPTIHKVGGTYVLLYIANDNYRQPPHPSTQRIGMLIADNINGPWKCAGNDGLILSPSANPKHWTYKAANGVNNPAWLEHPDGGYLLYFKSQGGKMGVAFADKIEGPYVMYPHPVTRNNKAIEDGYAFFYNGKICLLTTDNHGLIEKGGGILWGSENGVEFDSMESGFHIVEYYVGKENLANRKSYYGPSSPSSDYLKFERPQVLMVDGKPAYLYATSGIHFFGGAGTASYVLKFMEK